MTFFRASNSNGFGSTFNEIKVCVKVSRMDSGVLLCTNSSFDWNDAGVIYKYTCTWGFQAH